MACFETVKLQARKLKPSGVNHLISVPSECVEELGWVKGDKLVVRIMEIEIDGSKRKVLVYYKP
jgi:GDP-D-mannose dehydratase